ncbi:hypothetical protein CYMTET_44033 [Cymbomonas tetramitiformis]|uniref:Uncharacterized protein n=1 Tax=Cymbomonas tetramitiformis TaxID=36881 RepID=A0AAE0EZZ3_9CHLO|nr:hypothetical protein CYMTET_44033 [Cymbomonas tetramitiformis]|eukprot:gene6575-7875_t
MERNLEELQRQVANICLIQSTEVLEKNALEEKLKVTQQRVEELEKVAQDQEVLIRQLRGAVEMSDTSKLRSPSGKGLGATVKLEQEDEGDVKYVVAKGSLVVLQASESCKPKIRELRQDLIKHKKMQVVSLPNQEDRAFQLKEQVELPNWTSVVAFVKGSSGGMEEEHLKPFGTPPRGGTHFVSFDSKPVPGSPLWQQFEDAA